MIEVKIFVVGVQTQNWEYWNLCQKPQATSGYWNHFSMHTQWVGSIWDQCKAFDTKYKVIHLV